LEHSLLLLALVYGILIFLLSTMAPSTVSYEAFAPRSAEQIIRLQRLQVLTAGPIGLVNDESKEEGKKSWTLGDAMTIGMDNGITTTSNNDDDTISGGEMVRDVMSKTYATSNQLTTLLKHSTSLRLALRASINICEDISNRHAELLRHSGELSASADRLQVEETQLKQHAKEIGLPLQHYDAVDRIGILVGVLFRGRQTVVRGLAKVKVDHDEYPEVLNEIDEAVDFFGNECGGRVALEEAQRRVSGGRGSESNMLSGSMEYYRRALALQEAALFLIQEAVVNRISQTSTDISYALNLHKQRVVAADKLEASLIYTRFHGISARSNRLIQLIAPKKGDAYFNLLALCRTTYCSHREKLLKLTIRAHMDKLKDQHGLVGMTRIASVFLIRLCTIETQLYLDFFGNANTSANPTLSNKRRESNASNSSLLLSDEDVAVAANNAEFQNYLNVLCGGLHRTVRRGLVTVHDLDTLCQIVSVLREERGQASSSSITMSAARAIAYVIEDAQERLIFCANSSLQKEVIRFRPTPADLDYPNKLAKSGSSITDADSKENYNDIDDPVQRQLQIYESWFPPMRSVLRILSKIFRVVEPRVFEDIARDSVQACTRCLKDAASVILQKSGMMHADLFLVKHLLILREQLSPFDIELRSVERQLDFSDAGKAVSRFLANRNRRLFSMSTENALVTLLREGVSVQVQDVDSKRDLEDALRSACNDFIEHTSQSIARDILLLDQQCKVAVAAADVSSNSIGTLLQDKPFWNGESLHAMLLKTQESLPEQLNNTIQEMVLYLDNVATQSILLKPVIRKIIRALEDQRKHVQKTSIESNGWNAFLHTEVLTLMTNIENTIKQAAKTSTTTATTK